MLKNLKKPKRIIQQKALPHSKINDSMQIKTRVIP